MNCSNKQSHHYSNQILDTLEQVSSAVDPLADETADPSNIWHEMTARYQVDLDIPAAILSHRHALSAA